MGGRYLTGWELISGREEGKGRVGWLLIGLCLWSEASNVKFTVSGFVGLSQPLGKEVILLPYTLIFVVIPSLSKKVLTSFLH